jgi:predicted peptidase
LIALDLAFGAMPQAKAADVAHDEVKTGFIHHKDYTLFVPRAYKGAKETDSFPLILFLHGANQAKTPPEDVPGLGPHIRKHEATFPFFAIFPRGANDGFWFKDSEPQDSKRVLEILQDVQKQYKSIDAKRLYLTGVSMGGLGTWDLAEENPDLFAAIVPVSAGQGNNKIVNEYPEKHVDVIKDLPCWCFHGLKDTTVHAHWTQDMVKALEKAGGHPKSTYPENADHEGCWPIAYGDEELYEWLLKQQRK